MKKIYMLMAAVMLAGSAAANETPTVTITKHNGESITFEVADGMYGQYIAAADDSPLSLVVYTLPGILTTNENGEFVLDMTNYPPDTEPGRIYSIAPVEDLTEVSFSRMTGMKELKSTGNVNINLEDGVLSINGIEEEIDIKLYSVSGMLEAEYMVTCDTTINLREAGTGVHIVKVNGYSFKIFMK